MSSRIVIATLCTYVAVPFLEAQDARMVIVDGHRMRVRTAGLTHTDRGQPMIVLESGLGGPLEEWDHVFGKLAAFAPVLAYDRAGVGQSESDGQPPTPQHVARKLQSLLAQLGLKPPYVLVGHSWGAPLIRMFTGVYPKQVGGHRLAREDPGLVVWAIERVISTADPARAGRRGGRGPGRVGVADLTP